ncbi:diphthamide biosynthesis protein [Russula emetica]|nr:diphthamide biosynthesis protein [Russula emetica]
MTESAFSSSAQAIIQKPLALENDETYSQLSAEQLNDYYELEWTANEITSKNYMRVALQFPDELLRDSVPIYHNLKRTVGATRELYVLADTSYGSCCVDEVSAQHVDADAVVHYGHACMSKTYRLPVIYVFGKKPIDVTDATQKLFDSFASSSVSEKSVVLRHDVAYTHEAENLVAALRGVFVHRDISVLYNPIPRTLSPSTATTSQSSVVNSQVNVVDADSLQVSSEDITPILHIGASTRALTNLLLIHPTTPVHGYDPTTRQATLQSAKTNKLSMRRYAVVQKARDADVFGILVGTLGVASYLPLIAYLRQVLANAHKKAYTISVGKLNPAKLANFAEIECFVLVACPENSLIDAKDFFQPIVTPFELQLALQPSPTWTGEYVLDFDEVLVRGASKPSSDQVEEDDPDRPMFSLITGRYRHAKRYGDQGYTIATLKDTAAGVPFSLLCDLPEALTESSSCKGEFLQSRTFRGLETRTGLDPPSVLQQGRSGIARGYDDDHRA